MHMFKLQNTIHQPTPPHHSSPCIQTQNTDQMVSLETVQAPRSVVDPTSSPRISFSSEFLDEKDFISISPKSHAGAEHERERDRARNPEFEFLSSNTTSQSMITADELFFEGKLLPFWQIHHSESLSKISLKDKDAKDEMEEEEMNKEESRANWFVDDDPSPRPPKCTVLWKELLRLKKQRASSLSVSSSSSSSSASSSSSSSSSVSSSSSSSLVGDLPPIEEGKEKPEKHVKRIKKGLERTRSASIKIRPMINVPICAQGKNAVLPPLFPLKKGRLER